MKIKTTVRYQYSLSWQGRQACPFRKHLQKQETDKAATESASGVANTPGLCSLGASGGRGEAADSGSPISHKVARVSFLGLQ